MGNAKCQMATDGGCGRYENDNDVGDDGGGRWWPHSMATPRTTHHSLLVA